MTTNATTRPPKWWTAPCGERPPGRARDAGGPLPGHRRRASPARVGIVRPPTEPLRLWQRGLSRALASESLAERIGELFHKTPRQLACSGPECAKVVFKVEEERGRRGLRFQVRVAVARGDETEGNQAQTEANETDEKEISHVRPLLCDAARCLRR